jgi:hypothetical protein
VYKTTGHLPPTATIPNKFLRHPQDLVIVELILSSLILLTAEIYFPRILLHNQGYPKVCPNSLNLFIADDSFAGISSSTFCYLFFPDQGLDCYVLGSARAFSVRFLKLSLFQTSKLLHFIDFRRKFIKMKNQFGLKP